MPFLGKFPTQIVDPEVDIDGGAIDGVTIGATTASAATVTTLTSGNITTTGYIAGPSTFTIDPAAVGDNTGTLVVAGNLQVDGTTTTINSTTMTVDDLNITLASGAANAAAANGAGITVDGASATLTYNGTNDDWNFNKGLNVSAGHVFVDNNYDLRSYDTSANARTLVRINSSNEAEYGWSGAGPVKFMGGGSYTERMRIHTNGNVGIGTTSPDQKLVVDGKLAFSYNSAISAYTIGKSSDSYGITYYSGVTSDTTKIAHTFASAVNSNILNMTYGGNVGIGTTGMTQGGGGPLQVYSAAGSQLILGKSTGAPSISFGSTTTQYGLLEGINGGGFKFYTGNGTVSSRMVIDSSGSVGIGTASPATPLHINGTTAAQIRSEATTGFAGLHNKNSSGNFYHMIDNSTGAGFSSGAYARVIYSDGAYPMAFYTNANERMRIDSSGNLLVGTTNANPTSAGVNDAGVELSNTGGVRSTVASNPAATFNRKTDDGAVVLLRKDGTTLGSIGIEGGDSLYIQGGTTAGAGLLCHGAAAKILPVRNGASIDATIDLGQDSRRFKDLYLSGGAYLGGTGSANHLDDYEEGTWDPTITGNSGASGQSYSTQRGRYRKIGNVVHITFDVQLTNAGSISGTYMVLGGLPFSGDGANVGGGIVTTYSSGWGSGLVEPILAYISGSLCYLMEGGSTGNDYVLTNNNFHSSSSRLIGFGIIIVPA